MEYFGTVNRQQGLARQFSDQFGYATHNVAVATHIAIYIKSQYFWIHRVLLRDGWCSVVRNVSHSLFFLRKSLIYKRYLYQQFMQNRAKILCFFGKLYHCGYITDCVGITFCKLGLHTYSYLGKQEKVSKSSVNFFSKINKCD